MSDENLEEVMGEFKDGKLTRKEFQNILHQIKVQEDYLPHKEYESTVALAEEGGRMAITKYQFARCWEASIFYATGTTRG